jgi:AcrR family transcriptional regulator
MLIVTKLMDVPRSARLPRSARRKQLLAAAQEVFVSNGYHGAAMDEIADRAGVSKPVLYQHFPSKLDLYLALVDAHAEAMAARITAAMAGAADNGERLHNVLVAYFDFIDGDARGDSGAYRLIFSSDLTTDPAVSERVDRFSQVTMRALADTLTSETGLPRAHAELLSMALIGSARFAATWWLDSGSGIDRAEAIRLLEALHWRGISQLPLTPKAAQPPG